MLICVPITFISEQAIDPEHKTQANKASGLSGSSAVLPEAGEIRIQLGNTLQKIFVLRASSVGLVSL